MEWQVISPVDGKTYCKRNYASDQDIDQALSASEQVAEHWINGTDLETRAKLCRQAVECLGHDLTEFSQEISWQMGRPVSQCPGEFNGVKERAFAMIDHAYEALADIVIHESATDRRRIKQRPLGTILIIAPWNYPYLTAINSIIPALMAGNRVILKHASQTPLCGERLQKAFDQAGFAPGLFQYLPISHQQTDRLIQDPRIQFVCFTGSVKAGQHIHQQVAKRFIRCGLELGGKDAALVLKDADLDYTLDHLVDGSFFNSGQSCCGIERIYVAEALFNRFVDGFVERTMNYQLGNPLDTSTNLGPMVSSQAADQVRKQIAAAVMQGATNLIDPQAFAMHQDNSAYHAPQVLINVDHRMSLMREESFGPVVGIMPIKSEQEGIALVNDSPYGLTASLWTQDLDHADFLSDQLQVGTCFTNRCDYLDPSLAWTGLKDTGFGVSLSRLGYQQLTQPKSYYQRVS